jgi:hypothetical protein
MPSLVGKHTLLKLRSFIFDKPVEGKIIFTYVRLKQQEQVLFNGDLSKVSFANTDMTRVRFGDKVIWAKKDRDSVSDDKKSEVIISDDKNKFKIYDEWLIEKKDEEKNQTEKALTLTLEAIIAEYRNLRENYEYNLRYDEAGQFFIREMEIRRKYDQKLPVREKRIEKKNWHEQIFSFAFLYWLVSNYGESTRRPLMIIAGTFFIATASFLSFQEERSWDTFYDSVRRTLEAFFPFF